MIDGKNIMSWNVPAIYGGNPEQFTELLMEANFEAVCLKGGDGNRIQVVHPYSPWPTWGQNIKVELVNALRAAGIKIYIWHFLYGYDPVGEAEVARTQCSRFQPDGYIWNVEGSFDRKPNAVGNARFISGELKMDHPNISQGLCWWALPKSPTTGTPWHPEPVAQAFFETVDVGMPMMYWQGIGATAAVDYLFKSLDLWREMTDLPIVPIGRSYNGDGGLADAPGIKAFANEVFAIRAEENLIGNSWYSLDKAVQYPSWLDALQYTPKFGEVEIPPLPGECPNDKLVKSHTAALINLNFRLLELEEAHEDEPVDPPDPPDPPEPSDWPYTASIHLDEDDEKGYTVAWAITKMNGDVPVIETNVWAKTNDVNYKFYNGEEINVLEAKVTSDGGQKWFELAHTEEVEWPYPRLFVKKEHAMKNW